MANKKKSPIRKSTKKKPASSFSAFKQPRLVAICIFLILFAAIASLLIASHAASTIPATYVSHYPNCGQPSGGPLCHTTGVWYGDENLFINGRARQEEVWGWPNGSLSNAANYAYQTSHYFQYGPYTTVTIPAGKHGLHVCYYYASWGNNNDGNGYLQLLADLNYTGLTTSNAHTWYTGEQKLQGAADAPPLLIYCVNFPLRVKAYAGVEYRLRVLSTTDKDAQIFLWKTTVDYY